ncbi:MAG: hypothetical protein R6W96_01325 [Clostridia bacterium]
MGKSLMAFVALGLSFLMLAGCAPRTLSFSFENVTNMEIIDGTTGETRMLDVRQTDSLAAQLKAIPFSREGSALGRTGWVYSLRLLYGSKELDRFEVMGPGTIKYKGYFYHHPEGAMDSVMLESFFD